MKRNIPKNYNKPGKYGFCTLSSAVYSATELIFTAVGCYSGMT